MKKNRLILLLIFAIPLSTLGNCYVSFPEMSPGGSVPTALASFYIPEAAPLPATALTAESAVAAESVNASSALRSINEPYAVLTPAALSPASKQEVPPNAAPENEASPGPAPKPEVSPSTAPAANAGAEIVYPINSFSDTNNICLTFDDGGNKKAIEKALEVLKQNDVRCTFFVVGKYLKSYPELWKQAVEDGHQICNHTQSHKWLYELSDEGIKKEILDWETTAAEVLGKEYLEKMKQEYPYLRIPYNAGGKSKRVLRIIAELGYTPVGWNIETYYSVLRHHNLSTEPVTPIGNEVASHVKSKAKGGSIILLHFNLYDTNRLDEIISSIKGNGLTLKLLSEVL